MKKLLFFGLALTFGLSACEDINTLDQMVYLLAKYNGEVVGACVEYGQGPEFEIPNMLQDYDPVVVAEENTVYKVRIESTFPIWSLEHLKHRVRIVRNGEEVFNGSGYEVFDTADDMCPDPRIPFHFELKPKKEPNAGLRILTGESIELRYKCIFAHWGYIDPATGILAKGTEGTYENLYFPAIRMGVYSYDIEIERKANTIVTAEDDPDYGGHTVEYTIFVEGRLRVEPGKSLFPEAWEVEQWFTGPIINRPKYTGFKLELPDMPYEPGYVLP